LNRLHDKDGLIYISFRLNTATLTLAANGKAGGARSLPPLEAKKRISMALTGTVSLPDTHTNILMNAPRQAIQQE
jgi:hypothetical protein